jgi:hypothetical protein
MQFRIANHKLVMTTLVELASHHSFDVMQNIESIIDTALNDFGTWLSKNDWRGKEHDCVNNFAHAFLLNQVKTDSLLHHPAQICLECGIPQPEGYVKINARRDLVVWPDPFLNTWSEDLKNRLHDPLALMEWKAKHKNILPKKLFFPHDETWISEYTKIHPEVIGYVAAVYFLPEKTSVFWKISKQGVFSDVKTSGGIA